MTVLLAPWEWQAIVEGESLQASVVQQRQVTYDPIPSTDGLLSTVYNVEICATGIEYPLASGPQTFTPEDLIEAVASQNDPAIQSPRVWLGHPDDDRFHAGRTTPAGSAEPALGKVINMRVEDEGQTLVGDIAGCPTWLAKVLSSAYPSRSIEGFKDAKTVTGREWKLVISDLALLGVTWPGVSTLEDLQALYSEDGPAGVQVEETMTVAAARSLTGQINIDDVRRAFYAAVPDLGIPTYSWIRAMQLEPNELIVDDDEGNLYAVTFSASGDDITFGDPVKKKIQYVNASQKQDPNARALLTAAFTHGKKVAASWTDRTESRPENTNQEVSMTPAELRASIGLPEDATDDQVKTRLTELTAASVGPGAKPAVDPTATPSPDQVPDTPSTSPNAPGHITEPAAVAASAALPPGMIAVPASEWKANQETVQLLARNHQEEQVRNDGAILASAISEGKVPSAQREYYDARLKDPNTRDAFRHLLTASVDQGGLMANVVPVEARGIDPSTTDVSSTEAYPASWLPELQQASQSGSITMEA